MKAPVVGVAPDLPGVDTFVTQDSLKYDRMTDVIRKTRWHSAKNVEAPAPAWDEVSVESRGRRMSLAVEAFDRTVQGACQYIDRRFGNGDGEISQEELEKVFRRMRRDKAERGARERGRALVRRLAVLMHRRGLDVEALVATLDTSKGGLVSSVELRHGLARLVDAEHRLVNVGHTDYNWAACVAAKHHSQAMKRRDRSDAAALQAADYEAGIVETTTPTKRNARGALAFSEGDIFDLIRYLDPNADGDLSLDEFRAGLERALAPDDASNDQDLAFGLLQKFEDDMRARGQRIADVFRLIDRDASGTISVQELEDKIAAISGPSARERALSKLQRLKEHRRAAEARKRQVERTARDQRRADALAAGAPQALGRLAHMLRTSNFRLVDLFAKHGFDATGDGRLDALELQTALEASGLNLRPAEADALVAYLDKSGDGTIDALELHSALRRHRRDFSPHRASVSNLLGVPHDPPLYSRRPSARPPSSQQQQGLDPISLEFDPSWLTSLDAFLARHTGPQPDTILAKYGPPHTHSTLDNRRR